MHFYSGRLLQYREADFLPHHRCILPYHMTDRYTFAGLSCGWNCRLRAAAAAGAAAAAF